MQYHRINVHRCLANFSLAFISINSPRREIVVLRMLDPFETHVSDEAMIMMLAVAINVSDEAMIIMLAVEIVNCLINNGRTISNAIG